MVLATLFSSLRSYSSFIHNMAFVSLLFLLSSCYHLVGAYYYMAASGMRELLKLERNMSEAFLNYYYEETKRLEELQRFLDRYQDAIDISRDKSGASFISHPTSGYEILKRFSQHWQQFHKYERKKFSPEIWSRYNALLGNVDGFGDHTELKGAIRALIKLQETYNIDIEKYIHKFTDASQTLDLNDVFLIGSAAMEMHYFEMAKLWLQYAYKQYKEEDENSYPYGIKTLLEYIAWAAYNCHDFENAVFYTQKLYELDPDNQKVKINLYWYQNDLAERKRNASYIGSAVMRARPWLERLNRMCRGSEMMRQQDKDKQYCMYYKPHYQFYLKPMKAEIMYHDPKLLYFHNFLSNSEVEEIIELAREQLNTASVFSSLNGKLVLANYRISKSTWLSLEYDKVAKKISDRVGKLMNLNMVYSEPLQIANYGIGGNYESHYDHATPPNNASIFGKYNYGNRLATMLMYLSNVEVGGDTVFVETGPGVTVSPKKGSALFWYNLKRNGGSDNKTRHAGCPVLVGEKWISNLWIHEHGQEFRRPCSLNPNQ